MFTQPVSGDEMFCRDLPTRPDPRMGTVLVTGASGYIGGRLVPELLARGYKVRAMVRASSPEYATLWPGAEIVAADALKAPALKRALEGIDTAYYLIHSLLLGPKEFAVADKQAANNFRRAAEKNHVKRIIYLGGLGDLRSRLSSHLRSRMEVAEELKSGTTPVTILRAAVIIGSGSASYELIQHLVSRLPVIVVPRWRKNRCQPIAVRDVIKYLVGVLESPKTSGREFDIGGQDVLTYEMMLTTLAEVFQKKRLFLPVPFPHSVAYAYLASLITPIPLAIAKCLMEGLENEVICLDNSLRKLLAFEPMSYRESLIRAMSREEQDRVHTRWSDAYPPAHELAIKLSELKESPQYTARHSLVTEKSASSLFESTCKVGGKEGWFHNNWLWRLRGIIDRILLGVGSSRGRRSYSTLKINDVVDFWRIEDLQPNRRLLLRAEMKAPGRAWLEFNIKKRGKENCLTLIAYFQTRTFIGRIYWYMFLPFHHFIFSGLIKQIERRG